MADDKLEAFKIGDTRKPAVSAPKKTGDSAEAQSLGFRRIEGILETEDRASVGASLGALRDSLQAYEQAGGNKEKAAAKKAIVAVDRAVELMDFLFATKESMTRGTPA